MAISAGQMQGIDVYTRAGKALGRVSDVVIDEDTGAVAYVIVSSGGFLGIGELRYSLPWADIRFDPTKGYCVASHLPQEMGSRSLGPSRISSQRKAQS